MSYIVKTWKEIAKFTPFSEPTLKRKFAKAMLKSGAVSKDRIGKARTSVIWGYPEQIKKFFIIREQKRHPEEISSISNIL